MSMNTNNTGALMRGGRARDYVGWCPKCLELVNLVNGETQCENCGTGIKMRGKPALDKMIKHAENKGLV